MNFVSIGPDIFCVKSSTGVTKYIVTPMSCTCKAYISMGLPCWHIFKIREFLKLWLFDAHLVYSRWTKDYFMNHRVFMTKPSEPCKCNDYSQTSTSKCENSVEHVNSVPNLDSCKSVVL